jgi:hypothetical protein
VRKCVGLFALLLGGALLVPDITAAESSGGNNLLANPGFETQSAGVAWPEGWQNYASSENKVIASRDMCHGGTQAVHISAQRIAGAFQGVIQRLAVRGDARYKFTAYLLNDRRDALAGSAYTQLVVEWLDESGLEIRRDYGADCSISLSRTRWEAVSLNKIQAPNDAVEAIVGVHLFDGDSNGKGAVLIDDASFVEE